MTGALIYLLWNSWKNRLVMRVLRLKQPKYLLGAVVGGIYIYLYFGRFLFFRGSGSRGTLSPSPENAVLFESIGAAVLCGIVLLAWLIPHDRAALVFTEAEIAFLFPAPVSRKTLIHYKLLKSQLRSLITIVVFTLLLRRTAVGGSGWSRALGWWVILTTTNLHFLGSSFARTRLLDWGISNWKRRLIVLGLVAAAAGIVVVWGARTIPAPGINDFTGVPALQYYVQHALDAGPLPYFLYPFRLVVRPCLAQDALSFLAAIGPALVLLGLHYLWVVKSNVAFEEASVEASRKIADRIATIRANRGQMVSQPKRKKRAPFKLRPTGPAATGFLWKNLIGAGQAFTMRFWILCAWMGFVAIMMSRVNAQANGLSVAVAAMSMMFLFMTFVIGPQLLRQDFRRDLPMADVLKMYPMHGWQVALGELLAPVAILTGLQWLLVLLCAGLSGNIQIQDIDAGLRFALAVGVAVIAPAVNLVTLIIPNATVLLFPGWFQTGSNAPQGIEAMGQRLIFVLGQFLVLVGTLVPAAGVFAVVYFVVRIAVGTFAIPVAAGAAALVMAAEGCLGLIWLGRLFERYDVSAEATG